MRGMRVPRAGGAPALPEEDGGEATASAGLSEPLLQKDADALRHCPNARLSAQQQGNLKTPSEENKRKKRFHRAKTAPAFNDDTCCPKTSVAPQLLPFRDKQPTHKVLLYALVALFLYLAAGVLLFSWAANSMKGKRSGYLVVDALYFSIVTMTTVGYGDLTPASPAAKSVTCVYLLLGFGLVGALLSSAAQYLVVKQEVLLVKAIVGSGTARGGPEQQQYSRAPALLLAVQPARFKVLVTGSLVLGMVAAGVAVLTAVESKSVVDAVYVVCVTMTTLGYGDQSFDTTAGRLFASAWILLSTLCVTQFFLSVAEMRTEARQQRLADWVLSRKPTVSDLEAADIDEDGKVRCVFAKAL